MQNSMLANYCMSKTYFSRDDCLSLLRNASISLLTLSGTLRTHTYHWFSNCCRNQLCSGRTWLKKPHTKPTKIPNSTGALRWVKSWGAWLLKIFQRNSSTCSKGLFLNSAPGRNPGYLVCHSPVLIARFSHRAGGRGGGAKHVLNIVFIAE